MKEMVYTKERNFLILDKGILDGFNWVILSCGTHPCAYVLIPKWHKYYKKDYDDIPIECHYGLTFSRETLDLKEVNDKDFWVIGWDYSHCDDYVGYYQLPALVALGHDHSKEKRWTTEEIKKEVFEVIKQISMVER